ncbi:hypothetical protein Syun_006845 [Stephania yunnanensis]|uniref:Uncharacterized protein n=1 Tax=Stephania yunnanensis TaxID=152371 RepID=A0AAP0KZ33_9MAGN
MSSAAEKVLEVRVLLLLSYHLLKIFTPKDSANATVTSESSATVTVAKAAATTLSTTSTTVTDELESDGESGEEYSNKEGFVFMKEDEFLFLYGDDEVDSIFLDEDSNNIDEVAKFDSDGHDFLEDKLVFGDNGFVIEMISHFKSPRMLKEVVDDVIVKKCGDNYSVERIVETKVKFATVKHFCSLTNCWGMCPSLFVADETDLKNVVDAFFLGKALAEVISERVESTVGELLSTFGRLQAEQQKQVQEFQEEVLERAKREKGKAARESLEAQGVVPKPTLVTLETIDISSEETVNAATLKSVEFDEFSNVDKYLSELEEILEVTSHEPDITIEQNKDDEVEKEIGVIFERLEESQIESEEDQPLVLVKPPTLPCIFVKPYKGWK